MQYTDFALEDFLLDASFRNYCLGVNEQDVQFWEDWIAANPHRSDDIAQAKEMFFLLNGDIRPEQLNQDRRLFQERFEQHLAANPSEPETPNAKPETYFPFKKLYIYTALAAAVVAGFFILPKVFTTSPPAPVPLQYDYTQASKAGERKSFQLPDGSKVMLNAGSTLTMAQNFNTDAREVTLEGEAFFDVAHNPSKPFIIHTTAMHVKVLGTVFNVKAYPADKTAETSLLKGSVEITLKNDEQKKIILRPNEKIVLPNIPAGKVQEKDAEKNPAPAKSGYTIAALTYIDSAVKEVSWTENRLAFTENSFEEIAPVLERWYNVSIIFEDEAVKQYRYTATFDQKNIIQILTALQLARAYETFDFETGSNNRIVIRKR